MVKKDSLLPLTILIDFFQIAVYLTLFVLNGISCLVLLLAIISRVFNQLTLVKLFVYDNTSRCSLEVFPVELICIRLWACELA